MPFAHGTTSRACLQPTMTSRPHGAKPMRELADQSHRFGQKWCGSCSVHARGLTQQEVCMTRLFATTIAVGCALTISLSAQDTKTRTTVETKGGDVQTVSYTGCIGAGTEAKTFVLEKAVPVSRTTTETVG